MMDLLLAVINGAFMFINARAAAVQWAEGNPSRAGRHAAGFAFSTIALCMVVFR